MNKAARDNRANQLNPNNSAYRSSRGLDGPARPMDSGRIGNGGEPSKVPDESSGEPRKESDK